VIPGRALAPVLALLTAASVALAFGAVAERDVDRLRDCQLQRLRSFAGWLREHDVRGYVGEVGWPGDDRRWNALGSRWLSEAVGSGIWVSAWATGQAWGPSYALAPYEAPAAGAPVGRANPQAAVFESHPAATPEGPSVAVAGAEFGAPVDEPTSAFSNANPGTAGVDYAYDGPETFAYLASRGIGVVRIPFRWERLQPRLGQALDAAEVARLAGAIERANAAGLRVILDLHNYGAYYLDDGTTGVRRAIGSPEVPVAAFADVWGRIARTFAGTPGVLGYGLMNEPVGLPSAPGEPAAELWHRASQAALDAIRSWGDRRVVFVAGYPWSAIDTWTRFNPWPWIVDTAGNVRYEAHQYFDRDGSGTYTATYDEELAAARAGGC
jgi:hypothetical protein